ncbi:type II secretion system minor pseudopilin GspI [Desulfurivibrio sp. C05AmB]|uniref:type II secretion system minor pseudopilin GspI n=1 Tax=Desulfurivibrio sp. C05AmB TaxID=3374371 RepID=UPI00376ECEDE
MNLPPRDRQKGFTLMEILIALAVLSIVAITAVRASGNAINNTLYLRQQTMAHWVAMNKAAEILLAPAGWEREENSGTALMADDQWPWRFSVHDTPEAQMRRVEILVWPEGGQGEAAAMVTVYRSRR